MTDKPHNIKPYEEEVKEFSWDLSKKELDFKDGDIINIGEYCTDRICKLGKADKTALILEGH